MSDEDIPEELREGSEEPDGLEDAVESAIHSQDRTLNLLGISPTDQFEYIKGNYEQQYQVRVFRDRNGSEERGVVIVDAKKRGGDWTADVLAVNI